MEPVVALLLGFASGFVGAVSTGGGLISIPGLIFIGASPAAAIATTRLSALSGAVSSLWRYHRANKVLWRYIPYFLIISITTGLLGPRLLLEIPEEHLETIIGWLLLAMLPLVLRRPDFGEIRVAKGRKHQGIGFLLLFLGMLYGTMFGAGGGIFLIYVMVRFFGLTITESNATGTAVWLIGTFVALAAYISQGAVDFGLGIPMLVGATIGAYLGAGMALKRGDGWVKTVLLVVIGASGLKLLLF